MRVAMKLGYMRKMLILILLFFTSCGAVQTSENMLSPELLEPEGVTYDTAIAARGELSRVKQYRATVRAYSKGAFFGETSLRFKKYHVSVGQDVKQGDVLAELETKDLLKEIKKHEDDIAHLQKTHEHENEMKQFDIEIAEQELAGMTLADADLNDIELKKISIQKLTLSLIHQRERQELNMDRAIEQLNDSRALLVDTVITAPFDGKVVYSEQIFEGGGITAFKPLVYVADESRLYIEYSGTEYFGVNKDMAVMAQIGKKQYEVELEPMTIEEQMSYLLQGRTPPAKLNFVAPTLNVRQGDFASLYVTTDHCEDVIIVPINALYSGDGENYVYIMANGVKEIRTVRVGIRTDSSVEIIEGLAEGDEVFVKQ